MGSRTTLALIGIICLCAGFANADSPSAEQKRLYSKFERLVGEGNREQAKKHLETWQKHSPNDAELAVAWGNYYASSDPQPLRIYAGEAQTNNVDPFAGDVYEIQKPGTSETVGVIDTRPHRSDDSLTRALSVLLDAVTTHPKRTDIWMGATHIQLMAQDEEGAFRTLEKFARYVHANPKGLTTRFDAPIKEKTEEFIPSTLHSYALRGYNQETTAGLDFMLKVARLAQELYPTDPVAYNDEAAYHHYFENDEKVLDCLLRAHKVRPKDALVIINIGATYKNLNRIDKAREYFQLALKTAKDDELKQAAREELEALK